MNVKETATAIVELIGGKENIAHLEHCSTRLRFTLKDNSLVQKDALEKVDGVIGVRQNVQCQVIIGNDVVEVYDEVMNVLGHDLTADGGSEGKQKQSWGAVLLDFIISIFQPLIPAVAGGGVLKSLLLLASVTGLMDNTSQTYQILNLIGGAPLYFLPILVAITTANKLKVNQLVAVSAVGALILPELTTLLTDGAAFMGFGLQNIAYASQVFPAILTVLFYAQIEKLFTRISPKPIRIFFVPMMSLVITVPVALLILGPLGFEVGTIFSAAIIWLYAHLGWVATGILAAVLPLMVVTGMHKAMIPYAVSSMSEMGAELLYLPASLAHNIAEAGACFAVSVRTKDQKLRSTAVSSSLVGGAVAGLFAIKAFALVGPGLASITMFVDEANPMNLVWALVTLGVSFAVSFVLVLFLFKDKVVENKTTVADPKAEVLSKPVDGQVVALSEVNDEVFSSGMIGEGFGIIPTSGELIAPEDGEITMLFETNHAIGLKTRNGAELLFHIGLDTVQLEGKHFTPYVKAGDQVKQGQPLIQFDLDAIKAAGFDPIVICVVTNQENFTVKTIESTDEQSDQGVLSIAPLV